mgnify:FL=1
MQEYFSPILARKFNIFGPILALKLKYSSKSNGKALFAADYNRVRTTIERGLQS